MGLLCIRLVEAAGRQQRDARVLAPAGGRHAALHLGEEVRKPPRVGVRQQVPHRARHGEAVLQRIADAACHAHTVLKHAPLPARPAREVGGVDVDEAPARRRAADHPAREERATGNHRGRQVTVLHERLRSVDVGGQLLHQARALDEAALDLRPFVGADDQRHGVERPRTLVLVAGQAEGEAKVSGVAGGGVLQCGGIGVGQPGKACRDLVPAFGNRTRGIAIKVTAGRGVSVEPARRGSEAGPGAHAARPHRLAARPGTASVEDRVEAGNPADIRLH